VNVHLAPTFGRVHKLQGVIYPEPEHVFGQVNPVAGCEQQRAVPLQIEGETGGSFVPAPNPVCHARYPNPVDIRAGFLVALVPELTGQALPRLERHCHFNIAGWDADSFKRCGKSPERIGNSDFGPFHAFRFPHASPPWPT
jgi:hypothetical protein